jgi:hypothetical protein
MFSNSLNPDNSANQKAIQYDSRLIAHPTVLVNFRASVYFILVLLVGSFAWHGRLHAEENQQSTQYEITPYLWAASLSGTTAVEGDESPPIDTDYSFFSIENLDGVQSATFSAQENQWRFLLDLLYVAFEDTFLEGTSSEITTKLEGRVFEYAGTYKPASVDNLEIIAGLRQQFIDVALKFPNRRSRGSIDWTDPFVGIIYHHPFKNKYSMSLRADIGGFGIESDSAVNAEAMLRYQAGNTFAVKFGYRYLKVKFEDADLLYDLSLDGFLVGVGISF